MSVVLYLFCYLLFKSMLSLQNECILEDGQKLINMFKNVSNLPWNLNTVCINPCVDKWKGIFCDKTQTKIKKNTIK